MITINIKNLNFQPIVEKKIGKKFILPIEIYFFNIFL